MQAIVILSLEDFVRKALKVNHLLAFAFLKAGYLEPV